MDQSHQLSRQEADQLLLSLQLLEKNEAFLVFRQEAQELYDRSINSILQDTPVDIRTFFIRERLIGATQELKRFLDQPTTMADDLNQQITQHNNA
jgi:hypothetical protein